MKILINRAGQNLGSFTLEEIQRGLEQGQYLPTDLGWQEGMDTWKTLSEFPGLTIPTGVTTPPLVPVSETSAPPQSSPIAAQEYMEPPWERQKQLGFLKAFFQTVGNVIIQPGHTFRGMNPVGLGPAILFYLLTYVVAYLVNTFFWSIFQGVITLGTHPDTEAGWVIAASFGINLIALFIYAPLSIAMLFLFSGLTHLLLKWMDPSVKTYETTCRVFCYANAAQLLAIVPLIGSLIGPIWTLVSGIIGLSAIHRTQTWRATIAVLGPMILCIGFIGIVVVMIVAFGWSQIMNLQES